MEDHVYGGVPTVMLIFPLPVPILACGDDDCKIHLFVQQNDQVINNIYFNLKIMFCLIIHLNIDLITEFKECYKSNPNNTIGKSFLTILC